MGIYDLGQIVRWRWRAVILGTAIGGLFALALSLSQQLNYSATAQNFVAIGGLAPGGEEGWSGGASFALQRVRSYVPVVDSPQVLEPVIQGLGLDMSVGALAGRVTASNPAGTVLLDVTATGEDPVQTAAIATAIAVSYGHQIEILETPADATNGPVKVTLIAAASVPDSPIPSGTLQRVGIGLLLGLGAGVTYAIVRERTAAIIRTSDDLANATGAAEMSNVPVDAAAEGSPVALFDRMSSRADAIRTIRTNIRHSSAYSQPFTLAVTSVVASEGKTSTACSLAVAFAESGLRVCLVDADLRCPRVHDYLEIDNEVGLSEALNGSVAIDDALANTAREGLTALPGGGLPHNPAELLSNGRFSAILSDLRSRFDVVIVNASPVLPVADGAIVASTADGAILVARYGVTTWNQATSAARALARVEANLLGVVLNFVPHSHAFGR